MITRWRCVKCKSTGSVRHTAKAGVFEVKDKLGHAHWKKNGACSLYYGVTFIRVTLPDGEMK